MKPYLKVRAGGVVDHGTFGEGPSPKGEGNRIGFVLPSPDGEGHRVGNACDHCGRWHFIAEVHQLGLSLGNVWCASQWDNIPNDGLWWCRGFKDILITTVERSSLDFRNTCLEHAHALFLQNVRHPELKELAENEALLWDGYEPKVFIPFKKSHPQGYKGVSGAIHCWRTKMLATIDVHDAFDQHHILELD